MKPTIKFVISECHMGLGHLGLNMVIREHKKKNPLFARSLADGGLILFINKNKTACKLFSEGGSVIGYFRDPDGRQLSAQSVDAIPLTFGGSTTHAKAVTSALTRLFQAEVLRSKNSPITRTAVFAG